MIHTCTLEQLRVVGIKCCIQGVSNKMSLYEMGEDRSYSISIHFILTTHYNILVNIEMKLI